MNGRNTQQQLSTHVCMEASATIACINIPHFAAYALSYACFPNKYVAVKHGNYVIACNSTLAACGVRVGDSAERIQELFPTAHIVPRNHTVEQAVWEEIVRLVYNATPLIQIEHIGRLFCSLKHFGDVEETVQFFKVQCGTAHNTTLALFASCTAQDGTIVNVLNAKQFLQSTSVDVLQQLAISESTVEKLKLFGLQKLDKLSTLTKRQYLAQFGKEGVQIHNLVEGTTAQVGAFPLYQAPPCIHTSCNFESTVREPAEIIPCLQHLITLAAQQLQTPTGSLLHCSTIAVKGKHTQHGTVLHARRILKSSTRDSTILSTVATLITTQYLQGNEIDELHVELCGIVHPVAEQLSFIQQKTNALDIAQRVIQRFPGTMVKGVVHNPNAYLPEDSFRYEILTPNNNQTS